MHQRLGEEVSRIVGQVAGWEVVGAVDDDVVRGEDPHRGLGVEVLVDRDDLDVRVQVAQGVGRRLDLEAADVVIAVQQLALEVGGVDDVEVDDSDLADPGRRQVHRRRRAQAAGSKKEHARVQQLALAGPAHLGQDEVPRVAGNLIGGEAASLCHSQFTIPRVRWPLFLNWRGHGNRISGRRAGHRSL